MTARVVPLAIDDGHAGLLPEAALGREPVRLGQSLGTGGRPLVDPADEDAVHGPVGGQHLDEGGGPEPAVNVQRLVVVGIAARHLEM